MVQSRPFLTARLSGKVALHAFCSTEVSCPGMSGQIETEKPRPGAPIDMKLFNCKEQDLCLWMFQAAEDAQKAATLQPGWSRPHQRLAQAQLGARDWPAAVAACRRGETLFDSKSNVATPFTALLDAIAIAAALDGDVQGFDGRLLEVRQPQGHDIPVWSVLDPSPNIQHATGALQLFLRLLQHPLAFAAGHALRGKRNVQAGSRFGIFRSAWASCCQIAGWVNSNPAGLFLGVSHPGDVPCALA